MWDAAGRPRRHALAAQRNGRRYRRTMDQDFDSDGTALVLPWYGPESYPRVVGLMLDADLLPPSYDSWRRHADQLLSVAQARGLLVMRVQIEPEEFLEWCDDEGYSPDTEGRLAYAEQMALERVARDEARQRIHGPM